MKEINEVQLNELSNLFKTLYSNSLGFIKIWSGKNKKGYFYSSEILSNKEKLSAILTSHRFGDNNVYASLSTYKTMQKATNDNILNVCALALDVDYHLYKNQENIKETDALNAIECAILNGFPEPTYIEASRNIRLVYILETPYRIKNKIATKSKNFLKLVAQFLSEKLNQFQDFLYFNSTPQKLTSFFRIPYSFNKRSIGHFNKDSNKYIVDDISIHKVKTYFRNIIWDIDKLAELILPEKEKNNEDKQDTQNNMKENFGGIVCERRLKELEELQHRGYDIGHRENLCYLYWVTLKQLGYTDEETKQALIKYNLQFKVPLSEHSLLSDCKPSSFLCNGKRLEGWKRKFTDKKIREMLGLGNDFQDLFKGEGMTSKERSKKYYNKKKEEKILAGETKKLKMEQTMELIEQYRTEKMKWQEIADRLHISLRTAKEYNKRIKERKSSLFLLVHIVRIIIRSCSCRSF